MNKTRHKDGWTIFVLTTIAAAVTIGSISERIPNEYANRPLVCGMLYAVFGLGYALAAGFIAESKGYRTPWVLALGVLGPLAGVVAWALPDRSAQGD